MEKKQAFNPYLPSYEYVPDGEPHVFGDRVYIYGSHDRFGSAGFCLNDYVCYSASVKNLTEWSYEGVIYKKEQDPRNQNIPEDAPKQILLFGIEPEKEEDLNPRGIHAQWAPDVVQGPDGRFYLYYCLDFLPEIGVAVSDIPAGKYKFLGFVKHKNGTVLGTGEKDLVQFDPGVFMDNDNIYLYSGNAPMKPEHEDGKHASQVMELMHDMLTLKAEPKRLLPSITSSIGTGYEEHEFFEASSIRKINNKYYLIYSSVKSSELCYAVSDRPDSGYQYGGTLIDIGDIALNGRTVDNALNALGNTHGGIEMIDGQWYIFYHRQTDRTNYSRQGCAEKITIDHNGRIAQVEVTSCGLNQGPLLDDGVYPARICCHLTGKKGVTQSHPQAMKMDYPFLTQDVHDIEPDSEEAKKESQLPIQYIKNIQNGTIIGYKYFRFKGANKIKLQIRGYAEGFVWIQNSLEAKESSCGNITLKVASRDWTELEGIVDFELGVHSLYLKFEGVGSFDFLTFTLEKVD
ncbi:family 43 glycosylhydrolase [Lacrimispora sp. 38-1]|uniref:family 43 glycosylhydrolase n=1 Tax=Lacrimispora sp. 38-1 TaxID=3125778 RepID=UPI003CF059B1